MTRHLLRLIWNRKRHNLLLSIEIFFAFLVVLGVVAVGLNIAVNWFRPLGYDIDNIWRVEIVAQTVSRSGRGSDDQGQERAAVNATVREIYRTLRALRGVEAAAGVMLPPYESGEWRRVHRPQFTSFGANAADDAFAELMGLELVEGRWFNAEDNALGREVNPVVINQTLARELFGAEPAVGRTLPFERRPDSAGLLPPVERVVGVIAEYRKGGELATPEPYLFSRINLDRVGEARAFLPSVIAFRVAPGTTADFEETIVKALQPVAKGWIFYVRSLENDRLQSFRTYSTVFGIFSLIAGFLLVMVALGLTGVVWQMVTERTREFGLRRAKGASAVTVQRQVLTELVLIASLAVLPGALLAAQIPALPTPPDWVFPDGVFLASVAISTAIIYLVVLACGWYPSRLATKVHPAEALHYE